MFYLKMVQSRNASKILPSQIAFSSDEVFDTDVEFSEDLHINTILWFKKLTLIFKFKAYFLLLFLEYSLRRGS